MRGFVVSGALKTSKTCTAFSARMPKKCPHLKTRAACLNPLRPLRHLTQLDTSSISHNSQTCQLTKLISIDGLRGAFQLSPPRHPGRLQHSQRIQRNHLHQMPRTGRKRGQKTWNVKKASTIAGRGASLWIAASPTAPTGCARTACAGHWPAQRSQCYAPTASPAVGRRGH